VLRQPWQVLPYQHRNQKKSACGNLWSNTQGRTVAATPPLSFCFVLASRDAGSN
jgi:hypothetical protein